MDYNRHTYLNNYINKFRIKLPYKELDIQTLHRLMDFIGLKPFNKNIYNKSDLEFILNSDKLLTKMRKFLGIYIEGNPEDFIQEPKPLKEPNYYSSSEMKQASDELLKNDEVFYENTIKLTIKDLIKIVNECVKKIKETI